MRMALELIEKKFLGQNVKIGVPHWDKPGESFFYYGLLAEVSEKELLLFTDKRMLRLDVESITEIFLLEG